MSRLRAYSMLVLVALLALVYAVGVLVFTRLELTHIALTGSALFALVVVGLQYLISPYLIDWILKVRWSAPEEISPEFADWYRQVCRQLRIAEPRLGIVEDGMPNAFTYGHGPWNGRVVITRGLLHTLDPEEVKAVVAHELGHIRHLDFIVMTVVQALVLVLWTLYLIARTRDRNSSGLYVVIAAYVGYWLSYFISLLFSRVREYMADYASAQIMRSGNPLSRALVKIAYGLAHTAAVPSEEAAAENQQAKQPATATVRAVGAMGIASAGSIRAAVAWQSPEGQPDPQQFVRVARWDLYNPWAKIAELVSTHPLVAHRVKALQAHNRLWNAPNEYDFTQITPEKYQKLGRDLMLFALPWLGALFGLGLTAATPTLGGLWWFLLPAVGWLMGEFLRLLMVYPTTYQPAKVIDMLGQVQVSHLSPQPVVLEGELTGRLEAGFFWANDFILQDDTGFVAVIYRQPFGALLETLFGILSAGALIGKRVRIYGWYRRFGTPFVEIDRIELLDGSEKVFRCYLRPFAIGLSLIGAMGLLLLGFILG
ncbi:MAG: hypothetical protein KatS3mg019_1476 [Fimbriimonadales bacterium]|nr:MAG: hypothetical protein KatS3mg019_1476 [Fimbriimonadales bacterium]